MYQLTVNVLRAWFGRMVTIPDTRDGRNQTPVFFGYSLAKRSKEMLEGQYTDHGSTRKDFVKYRPGQPCPVCLVGKPGNINITR